MRKRNPDADRGFGSEHSLLIESARAWLFPEEPARYPDLCAHGIDSGHMLEEARRQGMLPQLYRYLGSGPRSGYYSDRERRGHYECSMSAGELRDRKSSVGIERFDWVTSKFLAELRDAVYENSQYNLLFTFHLNRILDLLQTHGIDAVPYKGPTLAAIAHGDIAFRQFRDLDLYVGRRDIAEAVVIMEGAGYRRLQKGKTREDKLRGRGDYEFALFENSDYFHLELHYLFSPHFMYFFPDVPGMLDRRETIDLGGRRTSVFSAEDQLLIICAHGAWHGWDRLAWILDVAALIRAKPELDWAKLMTSAESSGGKRMVLLGLQMARGLFGLELDPVAEAELECDKPAFRLAPSVAKMFAIQGESRDALAMHFFYWRVRERLSDRAGCLFRVATALSARDRELVRLPNKLSFFYFVIRPFRLAIQYRPRVSSRD